MERNVMTPEEFKNRMCELSKNDDIEERHENMTGLMCKVLWSIGYKDGVRIYMDTEKWYA